MFRRVTATQIIPAIALALMVSFGWFLVAYRLYKRDLPLGPNNESVAQSLWLLLPVAILGFYFWLAGDARSASPLQIFMCTIAGVMVAAIPIGVFRMGVYDSSYRKPIRIGWVVQAVLWTGFLIYFTTAI